MERVNRASLPALLVRWAVAGRARGRLAVRGHAAGGPIRRAEGLAEASPLPVRSPDLPSLEAMHRALRRLEAELYALEDRRRTASDGRDTGWT